MAEGGEWGRIVDALDAGTCPIDGCGVKIGRRRFLCPEHWRDVPPLLKTELREAARGPWQPWLESAIACVRAVESD